MKNRVLTFIIGVLTGAVIATAGFLAYAKIARGNREMPQGMMNGGGRPGMRFEGERGNGGPVPPVNTGNSVPENNN